ncbi:MAG: DUF5996 family protein [Salegentibacter sp.]
MKKENWLPLSFERAKDTYKSIHLWTQIAGKVKLAQMPWINHSWHVTLYCTPFGLTTGDIPAPEKHFQIDFDFLEHELRILTSKAETRSFDLKTLSVSSCYENVISSLKDLGVPVSIRTTPNELVDPIPFNKDHHQAYDPEQAAALHSALLNAHEVFTLFRSEFIGKCSPVHFFWGGFDLAVTRFSGRRAPQHPGGMPNLPDKVTREAYSHEVSSCGFWPGNEMLPFAAFYTYFYPGPEGFNNSAVKPEAAYYLEEMGEFILPYETVQQASDPTKMLLDFLHSTYNAGADLAKWDRKNLEKGSH